MTRILSLISCFPFTVQTYSSSTNLQKHHLSMSPCCLLSLSLKNISTLPVSWNTLLSCLSWHHIFLRISFSVPSHSPLLTSALLCPTSKCGDSLNLVMGLPSLSLDLTNFHGFLSPCLLDSYHDQIFPFIVRITHPTVYLTYSCDASHLKFSIFEKEQDFFPSSIVDTISHLCNPAHLIFVAGKTPILFYFTRRFFK